MKNLPNNIKRILICGLNNSGKTTLSKALARELEAVHWEADKVRQNLGNFDFTIDGRLQQAKRMRFLADTVIESGHSVICDFIAPTEEIRNLFYNDFFIIFMDTILPEDNEFFGTGKIFETPSLYHIKFNKLYKIEDMIIDVRCKLLKLI